MVTLNINTETPYNSEYIESIELIQDGQSIVLEEIHEDTLLKTTTFVSISADHTEEAELPKGCLLDFKIITPEPVISVEVSARDVKDNVNWASWTFNSERTFETWLEENNIRVRGKYTN